MGNTATTDDAVQNNFLNAYTYRSFLFVMVCLLMALPVSVMANTKGDVLRQTMADISLLNSQLAQRRADAAGIRDALSVRLTEIKTEVRRELQQKGIKTEAKALNEPRVFYDLRLMAEIQAYMDRYTQKISFYRVACDRLSYLYQQADDDLKIVNTLSDLKIDALVAQAEKTLDGYLADAQTLVIRPDTLAVEPPEKIWETLQRI